MQTLGLDESRRLLDAMGVPVVVLRERPTQAMTTPVTEPVVDAPAAVVSKTHIDDTKVRSVASPVAELLAASPTPPVTEDVITEPAVATDAPTVLEVEAPVEVTPSLHFTLVSVITADTLLLVELPTWASGLLDGRMTAICSDLVRAMSSSDASADWQYFHWPIDGMPDASYDAATEAVDAWLHRRWAEMQAAVPQVLTSIQSLDPKVLTADALLLPPITDLISDVEAKRALWEQFKRQRNGNA